MYHNERSNDMSTLRSLKKPKKHRKNIGYVIAAIVVVIVIAAGVLLLSGKGGYKARKADIRTEIVQESE